MNRYEITVTLEFTEAAPETERLFEHANAPHIAVSRAIRETRRRHPSRRYSSLVACVVAIERNVAMPEDVVTKTTVDTEVDEEVT